MRAQFCTCLVAFVVSAAAAVDAQTLPELVRANPNLTFNGGIHQDVSPVPLETVAKQATLVVIGRLESPRSFLIPDETSIQTDYVMRPEQVLAGEFPIALRAPGQSATPILSLSGGEVTIEGKKVAMTDRKMGRPAPGQRFLMFLQPFGADTGKYKAVSGAIFELQNDRMRGLLKMADGSDPYKEITDALLPDVIREVVRAKR
jgi:hypothetical protein